jgi:hypothetical protein
MRALILALLLAGCGGDAPVTHGEPGELVYRQGSITWRLQQAPCASEVLVDMLNGQGKEGDGRAAVVHVGERRWQGCWGNDSDADVLVVDHSGAAGFMPREWFVQR